MMDCNVGLTICVGGSLESLVNSNKWYDGYFLDNGFSLKNLIDISNMTKHVEPYRYLIIEQNPIENFSNTTHETLDRDFGYYRAFSPEMNSLSIFRGMSSKVSGRWIEMKLDQDVLVKRNEYRTRKGNNFDLSGAYLHPGCIIDLNGFNYCHSVFELTTNLLYDIAIQFNFSLYQGYEFSGNFGTVPVNYTEKGEPLYEGLLGAVSSGNFNIAPACFFMDLERKMAFDFGYPYYRTVEKAFMKRSTNQLDFRFFLQSFNTSTWFAVLIILSIFFVFFLATLKYFGNETDTERTLTFKFLVLAFWLKFVLLFAYYGGAMTTDLTLNDFKLPFTTFQEVNYVN